MMKKKQQDLLEKYINNILTEEEYREFKEEMRSDEGFRKDIFWEDVISDIEKTSVESRFIEGLSIAKKIHQEEEKERMRIEEMVKQLIDESRSFKEIPIYHSFLSRDNVNNQFYVIHPVNEHIVVDSQIEFIVENTLQSTMELRIENNQARKILDVLNITSTTNSFVINLPSDKFPEGRYYWKLWVNGIEEQLMGMFFVLHSNDQ